MILKNKSKKLYDYMSRYSSFPYYYNSEDEKFIYGLTGNLDKSIDSELYFLKDTDTLDSIALEKYGRPDFYWIIADFNDIHDPFLNLYENYNYVRIPTLSSLRFKHYE